MLAIAVEDNRTLQYLGQGAEGFWNVNLTINDEAAAQEALESIEYLQTWVLDDTPNYQFRINGLFAGAVVIRPVEFDSSFDVIFENNEVEVTVASLESAFSVALGMED